MNTLPTTLDNELDQAAWFKSTYSNGASGCIEVAHLGTKSAVRDTKNRSGAVLAFSPRQWNQFLDAVRDNEFGQALR